MTTNPMQNIQGVQVGKSVQNLHGERLDDLLLKLLVPSIDGGNRTTRHVFQETSKGRPK
jgi:hypothetical protein